MALATKSGASGSIGKAGCGLCAGLEVIVDEEGKDMLHWSSERRE
jgi:hypothetical protein